MIVQGAVVFMLTLGSGVASAWGSHFKVLRQSFFILWARHCQVSYPVLAQVLFKVDPTLKREAK